MTLPGLSLNAATSHSTSEGVITDFTESSPDLRWFVVNDNVMGGQSEGSFKQIEGKLTFSGNTNTDGGGFSSIRTGPLQMDLAKYKGIRLLVKGDGRRYTWRLATSATWRGRAVGYWADFETLQGVWSIVHIPFAHFAPQFRGLKLRGPDLDPALITDMGLMIYDKLDGQFQLQLGNILAYSQEDTFTLERYKWKNRLLLVNAPSEDDKHLRHLQRELMAAPEAFGSRDMILVTLLDTPKSSSKRGNSTLAVTDITDTSLAIQPGAFAIRLIGKDGSVKLATESKTLMSEIYALIDTMPMRISENDNR